MDEAQTETFYGYVSHVLHEVITPNDFMSPAARTNLSLLSHVRVITPYFDFHRKGVNCTAADKYIYKYTKAKFLQTD